MSTDMTRTESLLSIIINELTSIPSYLWGGFFALHVAIWRFLHTENPSGFGPVDAFKRSRVPEFPYSLRIHGEKYELTRHAAAVADSEGGYTFSGPTADKLERLLWWEGPVADMVERIAYQLTENTDRSAFLSGQVSAGDLPELDRELIRTLAEELLRDSNR